ncbi:T9SS type A sorting domain-containing protein [bacterium]|nr:T9SS type A sorting domain-containing protein [bacterium]
MPKSPHTMASVYGYIKDIDGIPITREVHIYLINQSSGVRTEVLGSGGTYIFSGVEPGNYKLDVTTADLIPDYLTELYWDDPYFSFSLVSGDSLRRDLTCYPSDTIITGNITMNGGPLTSTFYMFAFNYEMGFTKDRCDETGNFTLSVAVGDSSPYRVRVGTEITPLPSGYVVEGTNYQWDQPVGSHLHFNLISEYGTISGMMTADPDYPSPSEWYMYRMKLYDAEDSSLVTLMTPLYNSFYYCNLTPGSYYGEIVPRPYNPEEACLVKPSGFNTLSLASWDTVNMDLYCNYKHCRCNINLVGVSPDSIRDAYLLAEGDGFYPDCYFVKENFAPGETALEFGICDGEWRFQAPYIPGYVPSDAETLVNIPESMTSLLVSFSYSPSGVSERILPQDFILGDFCPNPFNASAKIEYYLTHPGSVNMSIFGLNGNLVRTLINKDHSTGLYTIEWDANSNLGVKCSSGLYFVKVNIGSSTVIKSLLLLK